MRLSYLFSIIRKPGAHYSIYFKCSRPKLEHNPCMYNARHPTDMNMGTSAKIIAMLTLTQHCDFQCDVL